MRTEHDILGTGDILSQFLDQFAKLPRHIPSSSIRDIQRGRTCYNHLLQNSIQKFRIGSSRILRTEFNIITSQAFRVHDGIHGNFHHLIRSLIQLAPHVNVTRGNERMNTRPQRTLDGIPRTFNIPFIGTAQPRNHRNVPIIEDLVSYHIGNLLHTIKIIRTRDGKPSLNDVHSQLGKIFCNFELFGAGKGGTGGLLPVPQSRVEDADVVGIGNVAGDVLRASTAYVEFGDGGIGGIRGG
mmetsp:Transcript_27107/g.48917  ORF Transcript_27107/g.48917 Transcript_27107/m.48917 type:complete len:240 (-) Transcript_27107:352-1071(-)